YLCYAYGLGLTPNKIIRVCRITCAEAASFSTLVMSQNLFGFRIAPNPAIIPVVTPNPPLIIDVDSTPTRSDEDNATSPRGKRKRQLGSLSLLSSDSPLVR
ncbi:unnamed protein product, partial [Ilex paraguariensis]